MLAIDGGAPVRTEPFPAWPEFDEAESQGLRRALESRHWWRIGGTETEALERDFANYHGAAHGLAVTNGTAALEVALLAHGVGPGDEVIVPAFTFISTSVAVQRVGAVPIPVDVDPETYCIDVQQCAAAIGTKTRAIIPVHLAGHFVDLPGLVDLVKGTRVAVIQDAAHAHGARGYGRRVGDWDTTACFSFQNLKLMTAGEGGMITFNQHDTYDMAFLYHSCGRPPGDRSYRHVVPGANARLNEFSSAVLRAQLSRLERNNIVRNQRGREVCERLGKVTGIRPQARRSDMEIHPYYMLMFCLDAGQIRPAARDKLVEALCAEGIPAFRSYPAVYQTEAFWQKPCTETDRSILAERCPRSNVVAAQGVWIHHRVLIGGERELDDVVEAVDRVATAFRKRH